MVGDMNLKFWKKDKQEDHKEDSDNDEDDSLLVINVLTHNGVSGLMDSVSAGLACGSDTAHLSMFGVNLRRGYYRGRGAFEAIGTGMEMLEGENRI